MTRALLNRYLRKIHLWLGIGIGLQIGLWLISGLFMTLFPIEHVRGNHLRATPLPNALTPVETLVSPETILENSEVALSSLTLRLLEDSPVYLARSADNTRLLDAQTGRVMSPLDETIARSLAETSYVGGGSIESATFFESKTPREYGRSGPAWRINFSAPDKASFYIDANTGELKAVRTSLWRVFDFMWGLHIMDWSSRENFNSWWIKATASLAVIFFLTGMGLAILRIVSALLRT